MRSEPFPKSLERFRTMIDEALELLVATREPACLYDPVKYVFSGKGKRLRPILVIMVGRMFRVPVDRLMPAAMAAEILHNFSLVHDDIMDQDDTRHGLPTVHKKWDVSAAILAGDAIFALAYDQLTHLGSHQMECLSLFNKAVMKLCEGQALDIAFESRDRVSTDEYLKMVALKTGTLLALCCRLGAILGNADRQERNYLKEFGILLGQSFQIQDDVLEIFSNPDDMGKSLGSDVITHKKTYLTCEALEKDPDGWRKLTNSLIDADMDSEILPSLRSYFSENGILEESKDMIAYLMSKAKSKLSIFTAKQKRDLLQFVDLLLDRKK